MGKGMLLIISGPSGSGKGTVVRRLCANGRYSLSVSVTTRLPREVERPGIDYYFCSVEEFYRMLQNNELLESTQFVGNYYGTPRKYVDEQTSRGKIVVLEIEVNGALQVKKNMPEAVLIFLIPQNAAELKRRLINRATEGFGAIEDRLRRANDELELIDKYDYLVINDEVENAVKAIDTIVDAELLKPWRKEKLIGKFKEENKNATSVI